MKKGEPSTEWHVHVATLNKAGLGFSHLEKLLGVSHTPWAAWCANRRSMPLYVIRSIEAHATLLETDPKRFEKLMSSRDVHVLRRGRDMGLSNE